MSSRFYSTVRGLSRPFLRGFLRLRVTGLEHIAAEGAMVIVANHSSYLDPAVLGRACPRMIHFLIKKSVYEVRGMQWFFRRMGAIPVAADPRDTTSLRRSLRLLGAGEVVGVFPEGGRSTDGILNDAKIGAGLLASRAACPIVPVGIRGARRAMPMGSALPRPARVEVVFGRPFMVAGAFGRLRRAELDEVGQRIMAEISALVGDEDCKSMAEAGA